jgi:hypothetical protein
VSGPYVVILTGGALPGQEVPKAIRNDIDVAIQRAGVAIRTAAEDDLARKVAAAAFRHGYHSGARDHRTVTAWVVDSEDDAAGFAAAVTRDVDPAYVIKARSPLAELLAAIEPAACKAHPDDCPNGPEPHLYVPADSDRLVLCCRQPGEGENP